MPQETKLPELQQRLMAAFPELTTDHFAYHATDLYVVALPGVRQWLNQYYEYAKNVQGFVSQSGSNWAGAGKPCLDIPFAGNWPEVKR